MWMPVRSTLNMDFNDYIFCKLRIEEMRSSLEVKRSNSNQYIFLNKNGIPLIKRKPSNNTVLRITPM